jgi:hypothetical protein
MRVYIVLAKDGAESISDAIREQKLPHYEIKDDAWLVASNDTTRELAAGLGIRGGEKGSGLVCLIQSYSGRLPKDAWEWLGIHEAKSE